MNKKTPATFALTIIGCAHSHWKAKLWEHNSIDKNRLQNEHEKT